jgi:TPR repeat protein
LALGTHFRLKMKINKVESKMKKVVIAIMLMVASLGAHAAPSAEDACLELGDRYLFGGRTLQNTDKAIKYYRQGALLGSSDCAKNASIAFGLKVSESNSHDPSFRANIVLSLAWQKVAIALGNKYLNEHDDSSERLKAGNQYFGNQFGRDVASAASQICSTIDDCTQ